MGIDNSYLYLEDPSCVLRSFETFIDYAWIAITCIVGVFLFGWAISMIRGAKTDYFTNLRNLIIMLGTLSAGGFIVNLIWGDDLFARGCRTIRVSVDELNTVLDMRNAQLSQYNEFNFYEHFEIDDSGATAYADAPLMAAGAPVDLQSVTVSGDDDAAQFQPNQNIAASYPANAQSPISAQEMSRDVVYTNRDGTRYRKTGGSRAWRNNNPGNIRYSAFTRRAGAIGQAGGFAVFPDESTGMRAISSLLQSDSYINLTIAGAISRYAPPVENDTAAYHRSIQKLTGLSINRRISDLSEAELSRVANAIRQIEGWSVGRIVSM